MDTDAAIQQKVQSFFEKYHAKKFQKGDIIIQAQDKPEGIYYVSAGYVRQYAISPQGEEVTLNIYKPGAFFPMTWAINDIANRHYFEAMEPTEAFIAPKADVVTFLQETTSVLFDLTSRVLKGLDGLMSRIEFLVAGDAYTRLIIVLLLAAKRFGKVEENDIVISLKMTHSEIATQAGMTRETVTREMKRLKDKGLISFDSNAITIHNLDQLESQLLY